MAISVDSKQVRFPAWSQLMAFITCLAIYNVISILTSGFLQWLLVGLLVIMLVFVIQKWKLQPAELGLSHEALSSGFKVGLSISAIILIVMTLVFFIHPTFFSDSRYSNIGGAHIAWSLIYMLVHTVIIEELVFRGVLLAIFMRRFSVLQSALMSSVLFGLWHIVPSLDITTTSSAAGSILSGGLGMVLAILGIVIATTVAGLLFCYGRIRSGSLLTPIINHWTINGIGLILAILAT